MSSWPMVGLSCWHSRKPSWPATAEDVVAAVQDEVWTPHVLEDAVERERLEPLDGVRHRLDAEHPLDVAGRAMPLVGVLPELVYRSHGCSGQWCQPNGS